MANATAIRPSQPTAEDVRLLPADEAAALIGINPETLQNWHRARRLRGIRVGRQIRWRVRDLLNYAANLEPQA